VLQAYLQAEDPESQEATLAELLETHAKPTVRRVVTARLAGLWDDVDDVCAEVRLELLLRLRRLKADPVRNAIADFPSYVAAVAANACNQYFRRRRPGRARLKKQIRLLISQAPEFDLKVSDGRTWCGLAERDRSSLEILERTGSGRASSIDPERIASRIEADPDLGRMLVEILTEAGTPFELEVLAGIVARVWQIPSDAHPSVSISADDLPAAFTEPELAIDRGRFTAKLWEEIQQLPRAQRVALLLNLRDRGGNSVLFLFPLCGVAKFEQIASTLEIRSETLAELWNRLPIDDLSVGRLLDCTRQQVINLRMAARKRLANRMRALR
jgi:RNA polymerase sigma factor (sigma-70 family)